MSMVLSTHWPDPPDLTNHEIHDSRAAANVAETTQMVRLDKIRIDSAQRRKESIEFPADTCSLLNGRQQDDDSMSVELLEEMSYKGVSHMSDTI